MKNMSNIGNLKENYTSFSDVPELRVAGWGWGAVRSYAEFWLSINLGINVFFLGLVAVGGLCCCSSNGYYHFTGLLLCKQDLSLLLICMCEIPAY